MFVPGLLLSLSVVALMCMSMSMMSRAQTWAVVALQIEH
jgi:hypothetical protein